MPRVGVIRWLLVFAIGLPIACRLGEGVPAGDGEGNATPAIRSGTTVAQPVASSALRPFVPDHLLDQVHGSVDQRDNTNPRGMLAEVTTQYGPNVSLKISDIGAYEMMLNAARLLQWESEEVLANGIARMTKCSGYPCQEEETTTGGAVESRIQIFLADRYSVELTGTQVPLEQLKQALQVLDLQGLAQLDAR